MSKNKPQKDHEELMRDLDSITPNSPERLAYQVGFLSAILSRIYQHDWILKNEWSDRIEELQERKKR